MSRHEKTGPIYPISIVALFAAWAGFSTAGNTGGPGSQAAVATSIAMAESGGDTTIISDSNDYGLWQINRATWEGKLPGIITVWDRDIYNPLLNAQAAHYIYVHGRGFTEWTTYPNASSKYLVQAISVISTIPESLLHKTIHDPDAVDNKLIYDTIKGWLIGIGGTEKEASEIAHSVTKPTILDTAGAAVEQLPENVLNTVAGMLGLGSIGAVLWIAGGVLVLALGIMYVMKSEGAQGTLVALPSNVRKAGSAA